MSLDADWGAAVPIATKPDPSAEWDKAKPVKIPTAEPKAEKPKLDIKSSPLALGEGMAAMGSGMVAKPAGDLAGLAAMLSKMARGKDSPFSAEEPAAVKSKVQQSMTYEPRTQWGQNVAENNPLALIGKALGWGGEKAEAGINKIPVPPKLEPVREGVARGVNEGVQQGAALAGARFGGPAGDAASTAAKGTAKGFMQSALKPGIEALRTGKADIALDTLLNEGVNVSRGGAEKLRTKLESLDDRLGKAIQNSSATVDKGVVASTLTDAMKKFEKQVNPLSDIRAIQKAWDEFLAHPMLNGNKIPVAQAQEMKRATYKSLGDKSYGELKGADIEAQKTLARGLKEEIAKAVPEVAPLNAEMSKIAATLSLVERRALMEANKNPAGLGWLTTNPAKFAAWMADRSGAFKSLVARMIYTGADALPPLGAAAGAMAPVQQGQIAPPPQQ